MSAFTAKFETPLVVSYSAKRKLEALLLLGPTGSGKSPLGDWLERAGFRRRRCHHFDFGANLRAVVAGGSGGSFSSDEIGFLRRVLEEGALLEDEHFPLAARILGAFVERRNVQPDDLLVLNGLPRHAAQAKAVDGLVKVSGVIQLDCDAAIVAERLRRDSGGDRAQRMDDGAALVARKLATYEQRTRPLIEHYAKQGTPVWRVSVGVQTKPAEIGSRLEDLCRSGGSKKPAAG